MFLNSFLHPSITLSPHSRLVTKPARDTGENSGFGANSELGALSSDSMPKKHILFTLIICELVKLFKVLISYKCECSLINKDSKTVVLVLMPGRTVCLFVCLFVKVWRTLWCCSVILDKNKKTNKKLVGYLWSKSTTIKYKISCSNLAYFKYFRYTNLYVQQCL